MTYYVYDNRVFDDQDDVRDYRIDNPGGTTQRFDTLAQANAFLSDSRSSFGGDKIPSGDDIVEAQRLMDAFLTGEGMAEAAYSLWGEETLDEILDRVMAQNTQIAPADRETVRSNLGFVVEQARNEAQNIVDTMVDNPEALADMEDPGPLVTSILEANAFGLLGPSAATPTTTLPQGIVINQGTGVTVKFEELGSISDINFETIFDKLKGYIPGISLPSWMPSAGVIFIPDLQGKLEKVNDAVGGVIDSVSGVLQGEEDVQSVLGAIGGVIGDVFDAVVYNEDATNEEEEGILQNAVGSIYDTIKNVLGGTADSSTIGTIIGGVTTSVLGSSLPSWLPSVLGSVFTPGSPVISTVRTVLGDLGITLPFAEEVEQDPTLMFTHRGDNFFVNKTEDEYFQLAESEDFAFEMDGQYTREQLENTGLETLSSGTYQSLVDDYSFYALQEDIYQYPMDVLIDRYEAEGGVLPDNWDTLEPNAQYDYLANAAINGEVVDINEDDTIDSDTTDDDTTVADLFEQELSQTEQNILDGIAQAGYATPADIVTALTEANLLTPENLATTLANAGFATPEDIGTALADAGFATPQDITDALTAAGLATPADLVTALSNAGYATPADLVTALSESGLATPDDIATALTNAGLATPQDIADAFTAAGLATPQDITDAIAAANLATPEDIATALSEFGFTEEQLQQIAGVLPENLTVAQLNTALTEALSGIPTGTDLDTATTTITDAISGLSFATAEDVRTALAEFGFTDAQLEQIVGALPEGLSVSDLNTALEGVVVGDDLTTAVTTITNAISGLDIASPDDVRNILANYGFTEAQLQQIVGALPEGLSLSDVTTALDTALSGIALGTDLDTATTTITDAIGGLAFATPEDVRTALAQFGFSEEQLNQIASVIPEGLSIADLNNSLSTALSGIALGTDLDTATTTITDAIGGLGFATPEDVQSALTGFNFTESQLNQISNLIPDNLTQNQVQDLLNTALTGVSTQEDVDTAFETLTTNLNLSLGGLEAGQEDILTGQEGLFGGQQDILTGQEDILTGVGEESQRLEDIIVASTGLLGALGAGGAAAAPRPQPYEKYLEKLDYAPQQVQMVQQTPKTDYQKEVDRLLMFGRTPQKPPRKPGMLA